MNRKLSSETHFKACCLSYFSTVVTLTSESLQSAVIENLVTLLLASKRGFIRGEAVNPLLFPFRRQI